MKRKILLCSMTGLLLLSLYQIGMYKKEQKNNESQFEQLSEQMAETEESNETASQEYELNNPGLMDLNRQNPDCIGWIKINGTRIDYPVMMKKDNPDFYLNHDFFGSDSSYGVPFIQDGCSLGISDNTVIYAHHMKDGQMFTDLMKYESEGFCRDNPYIKLDTLTESSIYKVIAVFKTAVYSENTFEYFNFINAESKEEYDGYIKECKRLSIYETGETAEYGSPLLTLSTCEYSRDNGRMVVVAKKCTD